MIGLARYAEKGIIYAALPASLLLILSLGLLPMVWLSSAIIAFVTLRQGVQYSLYTMVAGTLVSVLFAFLLWDSWKVILAPAAIFWMPAFLMALLLRHSIRLEWSLLLAAGLTLLGMTLLYLMHGDLATVLLAELPALLPPQIVTDATRNLSTQETDKVFRLLALILPGIVACIFISGACISLFLARQWQARLHYPGGFQSEFHQLRYGRTITFGALLLLFIGWQMQNSYGFSLLLVLGTLYMLQGLAVIHAVVKIKALGAIWLVFIYLFSLVPYTLPFLSILGLADNWVDFRKRLAAQAS